MDGTTPRHGDGGVLEVPLGLLREVAGELAAAGDSVEAARARPALAHDAGPAQGAVARLLDDADGALTGLAVGLGEASAAFAETAEDLADTDRQARLRLFEKTMGLHHGPA